MSSDHRLHPASILFTIGAQARALVVPGILVLFTAARSGGSWDLVLFALLVPYSLYAIVHYLRFTYRYDADDLVIRSGLIFRNERHIPYARIQNIDAVQNVLHRLLDVVVVRVHTGTGAEPEATFSVLPRDAFDEMRVRVGRVAPDAQAAPAATSLLQLSTGEVMLCGFIENYGGLIIGAALGLLWETGLMDRLTDRVFGADGNNTGPIRDLIRAVRGSGGMGLGRVFAVAGAFAGFLLLLRVLSMGVALLRLQGFTLTRVDDDLRVEYGWITRVAATIPMARVQTVTVRESPLQRLFGRAAIGVATAGAAAKEQGEKDFHQSVPIAPIIHRDRAAALVGLIMPEVDVAVLDWQPMHRRASLRIARVTFILLAIVTSPLAFLLGWWHLVWLAALLVWSAIVGVRHAASLGWAESENAVAYRSGWIWRQTTIARMSRIQVVALHESPFDRRNGMAGVQVDTVGGGPLTAPVDIRYLARSVADGLYDRLSRQIARTAFKW